MLIGDADYINWRENMLDIANAVIGAIPNAAVGAVAAGLFRNVTGWAQEALKDNTIDGYELRRLGNTIVKYFVGVTGLTLLTVGAGTPVEPAAVAGGVLGLDIVASYLNKRKLKK